MHGEVILVVILYATDKKCTLGSLIEIPYK